VYVSERNLRFLIYDVFDAESLTKCPYYEHYDRKMFDMVLKAAIELSDKLLWPVFEEMDRNPPQLEGDKIKVHPSVRDIMKEFGRGGWISATVPLERGGEQMPHLIDDACQFIFSSANYSASVYPALTSGAANLIQSFGNEDLFETYASKMYSGQWQGTMALTEAEAGSSLSDLVTTAEPTHNDYYRMRGQKVFISAGDHDGVENVVHLLLARVEGAPPGIRGLSLFVVPKKRIDGEGRLVSNDVVTSGVFHKLGYKGCPIVQISLGDKGDCRGYIVGEPNQGLKYMFQMMNASRIRVGLGATAMATAAYYCSLEYSKQRHQGRKPSVKDPTSPPIPIIEHADIKRMLLFQRSICEGSLSLLMQCSRYRDLQKISSGPERNKYGLLLEILTPVAKSYPSEMGLHSISQGLQCFGGSGYCEDYPLEQYYRDARIHPIHEGTTGIHGLDLLGRKVKMKEGEAFRLYLEEVGKTVSAAAKVAELRAYASKLSRGLQVLRETTVHLNEVAANAGVEVSLADATLYLEFFGIISVAWQWLLQAIVLHGLIDNSASSSESSFYKGKLYAFRYYFEYELPKIEALSMRLNSEDRLTIEMEPRWFVH